MFYRLMKMIVAPLLRIFFRPWIEGAENIPEDGPAIIASNHLSFSDSFFLPALMKRRVTFIAKAEYFNTPGLKGKLTAAFFKGVTATRGDSLIALGWAMAEDLAKLA